MSGFIKKTTGLTGLAVSKTATYNLGALYEKIIRALQKIPKEAAYRRYTEEIVASRMEVLKCCPSHHEIEQQIGCGQIEELIIQAENELQLARNMVQWKPWEKLQSHPPEDQWTWPPAKLS